MAIIYSYPQAIPKDSDLIIGTVTYDPNDPSPVRGNPTRSFRVSDLAASITGNSYTLTSKALGANSSIVLTDNTGFIAGTVNFNSGAGMSVLDAGNTITITNTGVLSNIEGAGISLSGTTGNVTITNSGVTGMLVTDTTYIDLSLSSATGDVTLTAALSATGTPTSSNFLRGDNIWAVPAGGGTVTSVNAGTGIAVDNTDPDNPIISNTGVLSNIGGTGISISGSTGNSTITNTAPDQTVVLTGAGGTTISGTYPSFTITSADGKGVEAVVAGTAISVDSSDAANPIVTNTAPDQTVVITGSGGATVTGAYPNFNISTTDNEGVETIVAGTAISVDSTNPASPIVNNLSPDQTVVLTEGDNVTITGTYPNFTISSADSLVDSVNGQTGVVVLDTDNISEGSTNLYDKTVVITGSGGATVTGTYPNFNINTTDEEGVESVTATGIGINVNNTDPANPIISNTLPDQTVVITGSGGATITGTYPSFNIDTTDATGVETLVAGTAISIDSTDAANPIVTNTAPDQTVVITGSGNTSVTGAYPNFNISSDSGVTSLIAGDNITLSPVSGLGDVTVNAPGLIPYAETSTVNIQFVSEDVALGGGGSSDTVVPSQLAVKTYVDNAVVGGLIYQGGYDASANTPILDSRGTQIAVTKGWTYTVTADGTFYGEVVKVGDVLIAETNLAAGTGALTDWTTVQSNIDVATDTVLGIANFPTAGGLSVTAGAVSLPVTGVTAGAYTNANITVDNKGRVTAATDGGGVTDLTTANSTYVNLLDSGTASQPILTASLSAGSGIATEFLRGDNTWNTAITSITAGTGLNGGTITTTGTIDLAATTVAPGTYTNANITVDQQGRITVAANGDIGVASFTASSGAFISLSPITLQTGAVTLTSDLSASGTANSNSYLRGDNTWATPVNSLITTNGTYISLTPITAATGAVTVTADLSASGTADNTTFLRGDNQWVTVAGTTYDYSSAQSGSNVNLNLIPSTGTTDTVTLVAGSGITLTDNGSNNVTVAASASGAVIYQGGYDATTNTPDLTTSPNSILKGWMYTVTVDGTFYGETLRVGDVLISNIDNPTSLANWTTVQSNIDLATAGTSGTAIRGLAGFNEDNFTVSNGFVSAKSTTSNSTITGTATVTHTLDTRDVIVQLYDTVTFETIYADVVRTSITEVTVNFGVVPTNPVRVLIMKAN